MEEICKWPMGNYVASLFRCSVFRVPFALLVLVISLFRCPFPVFVARDRCSVFRIRLSLLRVPHALLVIVISLSRVPLSVCFFVTWKSLGMFGFRR